jgi:hypothetical protein
MKKLLMLLFLGSATLAACNREAKTTDHTEATTVAEDQTSAGQADHEDESRDRANRMANRMATDMQFDTATQSRVEDVYYNRSRQLEQIHSRYNMTGTNQSGGLATSLDTAGMSGEMQAIDLETDNALRDILSPLQYKTYETNRSTYYADEMNRDIKMADEMNSQGQTQGTQDREVKTDGKEIKVKSGDIKVKAKPGESKVETSTYKSKIEGDERKYKSKDTKIKSEPGKTKTESGDTKTKIKE